MRLSPPPHLVQAHPAATAPSDIPTPSVTPPTHPVLLSAVLDQTRAQNHQIKILGRRSFLLVLLLRRRLVRDIHLLVHQDLEEISRETLLRSEEGRGGLGLEDLVLRGRIFLGCRRRRRLGGGALRLVGVLLRLRRKGKHRRTMGERGALLGIRLRLGG